jgi:phage host-nuclease inhibitor protein Gam
MKKEDISILAQLLTAMRDTVGKLDAAYKKGNMEELVALKKEIMSFQKKINELL